ncbi:MAG: helix-turn-helix transcriptional regulator [Methyloceanibacter sp.]
MARAALGLSVKKLAAAARVAPQTIVRFERGEKIRPSTVTSLRQVLEAAGGVHRRAQAGSSIEHKGIGRATRRG